MRLVIVDQSFEGVSGHHAEYTLCIAKEAAIHAGVTVLANQRCEVKSSEGIEIRPNFQLPWTQTQRARPPALYDPTVSFPAWSFLADLRLGLDRIDVSPQDHVFVHSIGFTEIEDLLTFAMTRDRSRLPVFDILLRRDLDEISGDEPGFQRFVAYLKAFAGLGFAPETARFFSDTEELSEHYTAVTGIPFATLGIAFDQDAMRTALAARSPKTAHEPLIVGYLGDARPEKGYQFLPGVAETLMHSHLSNGKARLRLQSNFHLAGGETPAMPEARRALARFGPAVELLYDPLDQDEYYRQLAEIDIVVLPYVSERYRRRSSGIFGQAAAAGKVVVVPRATTMCAEAQRYAMENCVFYDTPEELPEAVARAIDRHDSLHTAATAYQDRWCAANSPAALVATILNESAGAGAATRPSASPLVLHVIDGQSMHLQTETAVNQHAQSRFLEAAGYRVASVFLVRSFPSDYDLAAWIERNYRYWFATECAFSWLVYFTQPPNNQRPGSLHCELGNSERLSVPETLRGLIASGVVDLVWTNCVTSVPFLRSLGALRSVPMLCEAHALRSFQFAVENQRAVDEDELALELSLLADCDIVTSPSGSECLLIASRLGPSRVTTLTPPLFGEPLTPDDIAGYFDGLSEVFGRLLGNRPEWKFVERVTSTNSALSQRDLTSGLAEAPNNATGRSLSRAISEETAPPDPRSILLGVGDEAIAMDLSASMPGLGWYPTGPGEEGRHRWTGPEPRFTLELFLPERPYRCYMELLPSQGDNLNSFSIRLNDKMIAHRSLEKDGKILIEFAIPARKIVDHLQFGIFIFQHGSVFRPAGVADERLLGCAVCSIRFERQGSDHAGNIDIIPGDRSDPQLEAAPAAPDTAARHRADSEAPDPDPEPAVNGRALVIDDSVPEPDKDAGSNAVLQHILSLQRLGYRVSFIPADNMARIDPYTADLERRGVECFHRPHYTSVGDVLLQHPTAFDLVYLHRHSNMSKYGDAIRDHSPAARVLYSVADLHFLRLQRQAELENNPALRAQAERLRLTELALLSRSDCAIVHSSAEAELLRQLSPGINVHVIPWTVELRDVRKLAARRPGLAFIGGYRHPPNVDAAKWAAQQIMPFLRKQVPEIELLLVGSHMPQEVAALAAKDIVAVGYVPSLDDIFGRILVTIAPLRYGAGLKGKVLDSMAAGIPCVMTTIAAEGLNLPTELQSLVADEPHEIAERVAALCRDEDRYGRTVEAIRAYVSANYSSQRIDLLIREACGLPLDSTAPALLAKPIGHTMVVEDNGFS